MSHPRRVVVTGMGLVTPLGVGVAPVWRRLVSGRSGIRRLPDAMVLDVAAKVGGVVPSITEDPEAGFDVDSVVSPKDQRKMDRFMTFAIAAADEAIAQAGLRPSTAEERERTATIIGSGIGGFPQIVEAVRTTHDKGVRRLSPFTVPSFLANLAAGWVSIRHGLKGPLGAPVTACAAADRVSLGGFGAARALSSAHNDDPALASRPFDAARDGFVMGEGAGILVIEALEHALARGARPIAELVGYGTSADAHHLTAGPEDGDGARRAMLLALKQARLAPSEVDHINAHATSTPVGDLGELAAIRSVFGTRAGPAITSTKSATGHLLGAAGGVEAVFAILAMRDGIVPPTLNLTDPDPAAAGLDLVALTSGRAPIEVAMTNGFGFGGVNASAIFRRLS